MSVLRYGVKRGSPGRSGRSVAGIEFVTRCATTFALALLTGCGSLAGERVTLRAGDPVLITAASGTMTVAAFDPIAGAMIEVGTVPAQDAVGLTLTDFDWEEVVRDASRSAR
jgi:hypothetical protein